MAWFQNVPHMHRALPFLCWYRDSAHHHQAYNNPHPDENPLHQPPACRYGSHVTSHLILLTTSQANRHGRTINLTLPDIGDQIEAAVTKSLKHCQIDARGPSASSIGTEVGKNIGFIIDGALSKIAKPTFKASSLREQTLGRIRALCLQRESWMY
jgi:hypothetical protein